MKVFVVVESDADPYCGTWVIGVFSTKDKAETFVKSLEDADEKTIEEWELDSTSGRSKENQEVKT